MTCRPAIVGIAMLGATAVARAAGPPSFQGIGFLPGSQFGSSARAISDDGSAVTGNSDQALIGGSFFMAFRWQAGVMTPVGDLSGGSDLSESGGLSADGAVAAGMSFSHNGTEAFRWTPAGGIVGLGDLPGGEFYSHAFDVSGDGDSVVGLSRTEVADFPFRWKNGVIINLSDGFDGPPPAGIAAAVSHDGEVVVGLVAGKPFRWDHGVMELFDIPPDALFGSAAAVSPDGGFVVGSVAFSDRSTIMHRAYLWESGVMTFLDEGRGSALHTTAADVSADGTVVVGTSSGPGGGAFVWTPSGGLRSLEHILEHDFLLDLTGWALHEANGVSADGLTIAGTGTDPAGKQEAWIAHVGCAEPGDADFSGQCDGDDIQPFIACFAGGPGCGCADLTADAVIDDADVAPFVTSLLD